MRPFLYPLNSIIYPNECVFLKSALFSMASGNLNGRCSVFLTSELIVTASLLSLLGGLGSYLHGCREGRFDRSWINAFTEIVLALVVGLVVMYLGDWQGWPKGLTCVLILVLSNNGGDTLALAKGWISRYVTNRLKINGDKENV